MLRPILACNDPYAAAELFLAAGWRLDFSQPPESGDPLVGVSLHDNHILLGITDGYVSMEQEPFIGCGVVLYLTVPTKEIENIHAAHRQFSPSDLTEQPWSSLAFEVRIGGFQLMIAAE